MFVSGRIIAAAWAKSRFSKRFAVKTRCPMRRCRKSSAVQVGIIHTTSLGCVLLDFNKLFHPPHLRKNQNQGTFGRVGAPFTYVYPWYLLCSRWGFLEIITITHKYPRAIGLIFWDFPWRGPTLGRGTSNELPWKKPSALPHPVEAWIMAGQPTPPNVTPPRNKALLTAY